MSRRNRRRAAVLLVLALPVAAVLAWLARDAGRSFLARHAGAAASRPLRYAAAGGAAPPASSCRWQRLWTWPAGAALPEAPAPLDDGWIVATQDGRLAALNAGGRVRWIQGFTNLAFATGATQAGSVAVAVADNGLVVAVRTADGQPLWRRQLAGAFRHAPLAWREGDAWRVALLSGADGVLTALDADDGRERWTSPPTNRSDGAPATDGRRIAFGNCDAAVHVLDAATGEEAARVPVGADAQMAGGVAWTGGRVCGGTRDGRLVAVDVAAGAIAWETNVAPAEAFVTPAVAGGLVVTGSRDGDVTAVDAATGAERWRAQTEGGVDGLAAADDAVFVNAAGVLHGLRLADCRAFCRFPVGDNVRGPAANGREVVVGDDGGNVIGFGGQAP